MNFNKKIRKVFESEKEFESKSINIANWNNSSKVLENNLNNPYSNLELSATLLEYQNEDENMLSFSSKAITKIDLSNLTKGNTIKNCLQSKISTMKSVNDLEVTSKIDKSTASPNTRKIMKIQNQKIKNLQEKVSQLLIEKEQHNESENSWNFIHKNELLKILSKLLPQMKDNKQEKWDSTTASEQLSYFVNNDRNLSTLANLIYSSDDSKHIKQAICFNTNQSHHQCKSELIPTFVSETIWGPESNSAYNSVKVNDESRLKIRDNYFTEANTKERMNDVVTVFQSNLSKIDEIAKNEDQSSVSDQSCTSFELNKLQWLQSIKDHSLAADKVYSNLAPTFGLKASKLNEVQR